MQLTRGAAAMEPDVSLGTRLPHEMPSKSL